MKTLELLQKVESVKARALFQAWEMIKRVYNEMNK